MRVLRCGKCASPSPPPPPPSHSPDEITAVESEEQLCLTPEEGKVLSTDSMMRCLEVAVDHWHAMSRTMVQVCGCVTSGFHRERLLFSEP